ncbi:MAG: hypothetical protein ACREBU_09245 [Nitrososphaera sp.]
MVVSIALLVAIYFVSTDNLLLTVFLALFPVKIVGAIAMTWERGGGAMSDLLGGLIFGQVIVVAVLTVLWLSYSQITSGRS